MGTGQVRFIFCVVFILCSTEFSRGYGSRNAAGLGNPNFGDKSEVFLHLGTTTVKNETIFTTEDSKLSSDPSPNQMYWNGSMVNYVPNNGERYSGYPDQSIHREKRSIIGKWCMNGFRMTQSRICKRVLQESYIKKLRGCSTGFKWDSDHMQCVRIKQETNIKKRGCSNGFKWDSDHMQCVKIKQESNIKKKDCSNGFKWDSDCMQCVKIKQERNHPRCSSECPNHSTRRRKRCIWCSRCRAKDWAQCKPPRRLDHRCICRDEA